MSPGMQVALIAMGGIAVWIIVSFYWLRVLACAALVFIWGIVGVIVPLYLGMGAILSGNFSNGMLTLAVLAVTGTLWVIAFMQAREWLRRTRKAGFFRTPWNAR